METSSPYSTPKAQLIDDSNKPRRNLFAETSTQRLKKLYNSSRTITSTAGLAICIIAGCLLLIFQTSFPIDTFKSFITIVLPLNVALAIVCIWRCKGAQALMALAGLSMLPFFPIGTFLGVSIIAATWKTAELFGPQRIQHKDLETEFKYRQKNKIK